MSTFHLLSAHGEAAEDVRGSALFTLAPLVGGSVRECVPGVEGPGGGSLSHGLMPTAAISGAAKASGVLGLRPVAAKRGVAVTN